jgi:hypothetical protein
MVLEIVLFNSLSFDSFNEFFKLFNTIFLVFSNSDFNFSPFNESISCNSFFSDSFNSGNSFLRFSLAIFTIEEIGKLKFSFTGSFLLSKTRVFFILFLDSKIDSKFLIPLLYMILSISE